MKILKILYKILIPVIALLTIPAFLKTPLVCFVMSSSTEGAKSMAENLGIKQKSTYSDIKGYSEKYADVLEGVFGAPEDASGDETDFDRVVSVIPSAKYLKNVGFYFAVDAVCVLLVIALAVFTKKRWLVSLFALVGAGSTMLLNSAFNKFAEPILSGVTDLAGIFSSALGGDALGGLLGGGGLLSGLTNMLVGRVTVFRLDICYNIFLVIFVSIAAASAVCAIALRDE